MKLTTKYRIFVINEDGHLKIPADVKYGHIEDIFDDYQSMQAAEKAILNNADRHGEFIILPIITKVWRSKHV